MLIIIHYHLSFDLFSLLPRPPRTKSRQAFFGLPSLVPPFGLTDGATTHNLLWQWGSRLSLSGAAPAPLAHSRATKTTKRCVIIETRPTTTFEFGAKLASRCSSHVSLTKSAFPPSSPSPISSSSLLPSFPTLPALSSSLRWRCHFSKFTAETAMEGERGPRPRPRPRAVGNT